jgi:hypothetical protein
MGYQNYESGRRIPPGTVLSRISLLCGVTVDWILTGKGIVYENFVAESDGIYGLDETIKKVVTLMVSMDKKDRLGVLKYVEERIDLNKFRGGK